ncbi:MAG: PepSY-like domain-containing protein [Duncaniella sp.]|nr:PepSY-like domain-containing protein [Duncaniella sp.]MDE5752637.1 PepSY-like domain-containing protein [Duncaniella sp.]MDE6572434.1 PepSY-like domain-containing protein [Duncaniella sp.]
MKKLILILTAVLLSVGVAYADKYTLKRENLPQQAREMLDEYFPKAKVAMIKVDKHLLKKTDYDVKLVNGTKIEFNNAGRWTSIDCRDRAVPDAIIPRAIRKYVTKNFEGVKITEIERKLKGFEIELDNGLELTFDTFGNFKSMNMDK